MRINEGEPRTQKNVTLPCLIHSLASLRDGGEVMPVKVMVPENPQIPLVNKKAVVIKEQPPQCPLQGELIGEIMVDFGETILVEVGDKRYVQESFIVPKEWLKKKKSKK